LTTEFPRIEAEARKHHATIWFGDEAGVRSDAHAGTTWAPKGKTPVITTTGARFGLNLISAVTRRGDLRFMGVRGRVNAAVFIEFLQRLIDGEERPVFLVVDGHPVHKANRVQKFVASTQGRLRLYFLPPYSPELNPDEQVWNDLKNNGLGRIALSGPDELHREAISHLRFLQKSPHLIRSFFQMSSTRYAA
jgi:transposase